MSLSDKFKRLIRPRKSKKLSDMSQTLLKSDKKIEPIKKVEFNIPIDAYNLMSEVENNFNYFYSKVEHRKYVPSFIQTSIKTYIANMYESYLQYQKLFYFFGKGSLREKKVKSKYEDIKKICEKYKQDNEIPIAKKVTDIGKNIDSIILKYVNFFKEKKYVTKRIKGEVDTAGLGALLCAMFDSLDIALVQANSRIEQLKNIVLDDTSKLYYADIRGCTTIIDECLEKIAALEKKFSIVVSKIDFKFLRKHNSKDLSKINATISTIESGLDITHVQFEEYYQIALNIVSSKDKSVSDDSNKLANLLTSKENYIRSREKILSTVKTDYQISDLSNNINELEKFTLNLGKIVKDKIKSEGPALEYSKVQLFKSELLKLKEILNTSSREMDALVGTAHSAKAAIQYALSPMRKVEKVLDVVKRITGAANQCSSAVKAVSGVLAVL